MTNDYVRIALRVSSPVPNPCWSKYGEDISPKDSGDFNLPSSIKVLEMDKIKSLIKSD